LIELHTAPLACAILPLDRCRDEAAHADTLAAVCFTPLSNDAVAASLGAPFANVPMPLLDDDGMPGSVCEIWKANGTLRSGRHGDIVYRHNDDILFGTIQLNEAQFDTADVALAGKTPLQAAAETAYRTIFELIDALRFPHILRFWNYIAHINIASHGGERYRQFNIGRQSGFLHGGRQTAGGVVPAASAVGCDAGPLTVQFIAGRGAMPVAVENPRQVSAYHYPTQYGQRSPTFSRASVTRVGDADLLFLSGTASIVGHQSMHAGDPVAQVQETLANIRAVLGEAGRVAPRTRFTLDDLCYRVYVRRPEDLAAIRRTLREALGASARLLFLRADICRHDLLVEIEATAGHPAAFAPE